MFECVLSATGLYTPEGSISNAELVAAHVAATRRYNARHAAAIETGAREPRDESSERFIVKASGIHHRYVVDKQGVLDPERLRPRIPLRGDDEPSFQCELALRAIWPALERARRAPGEVDAVIVACSNLQRAYPAVAIEVQSALGAGGFAYDLNVACSSATFGIQAGVDAVRCGSARCVVVVNPEITSAHTNFEIRDSHFIFGDACTAAVIEPAGAARVHGFEVLGTRLATSFSSNIRNNFGFLNRCEEPARSDPHDLLFRQNGRQVVQDVCPQVIEHIRDHLKQLGLEPSDLKRLWLHQANLKMNQTIGRGVLGREPGELESPVILDEYANTSSAGSVIALHKYSDDLDPGDLGILCSFGAGYSIGSVVLRRRG